MPKLGYTRIILDFHFSEYPKDVLVNVNAKKIVDTVSKAGTDSLIFYAKDHWGNVYHNTKISHKHKNVPYDLFGQVLDEANKTGLNIIAYYTVQWDEYSARNNTDWRFIDTHGKPFSAGGNKWKFLCINSPYRDYTFAQINELVSNYDFSAIWVDIVFYLLDSGAPCYCRYCQKLWQAQYGGEIPKVLEGNDKAKYLDFRDGFVARYLKKIYEIIKSSGKNIQVTHNFGTVFDYDDYVTKEAEPYGNDYFINSIQAKIYRAYARGKDLEILTGRFNQFWDFTVKPKELLTWEAATILAHNASICVIDQPNIDGTLDSRSYECISYAFKHAKRIASHIENTKPYSEIGLFYSERNYELDQDTNLDFKGAFKVLTEAHLPFDVVDGTGLTLEGLKHFKLLIIPYVIYLDEDRIDIIKAYIDGGGKVLTCYRTATRDEETNLLKEGVFGLVNISSENTSKVNFIKPIFDIENYYLRIGENCLVEIDNKTETLGKIVKPALECTEDKWVSHDIQPGDETDSPAIVFGKKGKGEYIYFNHRIFAEYLKRDMRTYRETILQSIYKLYTPEIWVEAPRVVEANYHTRDKELKIILTSCIVGRPIGKKFGEGCHNNIDEVIPIFDIKIKMTRRVTEAKDMDNNLLQLNREDGITTITLPKLEQYQVVTLYC